MSQCVKVDFTQKGNGTNTMAGACNDHSKEEQCSRELSSFTGNKTSRSNEIQCLRCTRRAQRANGTVQGDILIKGKVLLLRVCYLSRHDASTTLL